MTVSKTYPAVQLLDAASLWITSSVTEDDIDQERLALEEKYDRPLAVHEITHPTHSGVRCTRVEWQCL